MTTQHTLSLYGQGLLEANAVEAAEYNLVAILKPRISIDGNQWCVLFGENLQDGVCGFGDTAYDAVIAFKKAWHTKVGASASTLVTGEPK